MSFALFEEKCKNAGLSQAAVDAFKHNYDQLLAGETGLVGYGRSEVVSRDCGRLSDTDSVGSGGQIRYQRIQSILLLPYRT
jgi:hypothetical protein